VTSGTNSIGIAAYDALQSSVRQRLDEGLEFIASYTYGKALSDNVGYYGTGWGQTGAQGYYYLDSSNPRRDYSRSTYDARHSFSLAGTYELPFGRGRRTQAGSGLTEAVFGGWSVHGILQARSGFAFSVIDSGGQSLQATRSNERPDRLCDGATNASGPDDTWIDISCFARAPVGQFGTSGHNILSGPGYWNVDFAVSKNIHIDDRRYFTFKIEAFNALNHPNWGAPSSDISDPNTFGRIQQTFSAPRIVELVGKFTY
jgi:hypothetical protein